MPTPQSSKLAVRAGAGGGRSCEYCVIGACRRPLTGIDGEKRVWWCRARSAIHAAIANMVYLGRTLRLGRVRFTNDVPV